MIKLFASEEEEQIIREFDQELYEDMKRRESLLIGVYNYLVSGGVVFINQGQKVRKEGLVHPNTKGETPFQFSYFDQYGAVGDFQRDTLEEVAKEIVAYGFVPANEKELRYIS
ncbi:hypothetical protein PP175_29205 (plasmid) [Aneurinibacillus sp. Ricciae_BoGa-3]|uniref:hypothetical protein n=1 Tax=Aneurinibacillus sp. Ricciae_BoGa-3 TaxID=3022697 RepID=UPI0023401BA9|nr:hypothetical protein [Aneurinibacillus sp. Ricciae_BoGa-3]WCK57271.1 hypothetical protein PP175_29205 [Aneurinibacillus sp. Ricciae_BoGa-3]